MNGILYIVCVCVYVTVISVYEMWFRVVFSCMKCDIPKVFYVY